MTRLAILFLASCLAACASTHGPAPGTAPDFTVLSWNVSGDAFVTRPREFRALVNYADPDILLLDEVHPRASTAQLLAALPSGSSAGSTDGSDRPWHVSYGTSGGRQRGVIASRALLEAVPEFAGILPYPDDARHRIEQRVPPAERAKYERSMSAGIAVNGAIVRTNGRRLLVVIADFECCGDDPASWQELKRRTEAKEIRSRIRRVLERTSVDGIVVAGDFNLVSTAIPLALVSGPYEKPHSGLIAAELYHLDGAETWTWYGRGTPFPSRALDYTLYSPDTLRLVQGFVLDTADMTPELLESHRLDAETARTLSSHRPLVARYAWH